MTTKKKKKTNLSHWLDNAISELTIGLLALNFKVVPNAQNPHLWGCLGKVN